MHVRWSMRGVEVLAPAKVNLFLEVLGKRSDGFHEIETLMVPIALWDALTFSANRQGSLSLRCRALGPDREAPPDGPENLVLKALALLKSHSGTEMGADVELIKRIPMAAGLAGGSSDCAAALVAGNLLWKLDWPIERLAELAAELGSDVPFFLGKGAAICRGRGERIEPLGPTPPLHLVIAKPNAGLATGRVYANCRPAEQPEQVGELVELLRQGRAPGAAHKLVNRLQPAAESLSPEVSKLRAQFARLDLLGHQMSGSGTSYFGVCRHALHARRTAALLRSRGVGQVFAVSSC